MILNTGSTVNQSLLIEVWDWEQKGNHNLLGSANVVVRDMLFPTPYFSLLNSKGDAAGSFFIESVTPLAAGQLALAPRAFTFHCSASKLDKKDGPLSKSGTIAFTSLANINSPQILSLRLLPSTLTN